VKLNMKLKSAGNTVTTQVMDHYGIVAATCNELKIAERINKRISSKDPRRVIQPGTLNISVATVEKHAKKGRPVKGTAKVVKGYKVIIGITRNTAVIARHLRKKGRFIIATNNLSQELSGLAILSEYKDQQCVESGFKFLKDPWFMVDSFFVKKANRIAALMMVMTLSLLVYNFAQHKLRQALKEEKTTIPNQLGKAIQTPTLKWVFQIMEGVGIVQVYGNSQTLISAMVTNLDDLRVKIIRLLGTRTCEMYGIE
jgi:transposase